jgi:hypothetical protein
MTLFEVSAEDATRVRNAERTYNHPLAVRFRNWMVNTRTNTIRSAWQVIGLKYMSAGQLFGGDYEPMFQKFNKHERPTTGEEYKDWYSAMGNRINAAQPYLWAQDMWDMAMAPKLPRHTISGKALPYHNMFMTFEYGKSVDIESLADPEHFKTQGMTFSVQWMALYGLHEELEVCLAIIDDDSATQGFVLTMTIPFGSVWPDAFHPMERPCVEEVLKLLAFVNSPYVENPAHPIERTERKEVARSNTHKEGADETVNVVRLRRAQPKQAANVTNEPRGSGVRFHEVTGHYKPQWYPSEEAHHVIWIAPYERGDLSLGVVQKVYHVTR